MVVGGVTGVSSIGMVEGVSSSTEPLGPRGSAPGREEGPASRSSSTVGCLPALGFGRKVAALKRAMTS